MNLCACDSKEREHGVGGGVNATVLSETLQVAGVAGAENAINWNSLQFMSCYSLVSLGTRADVMKTPNQEGYLDSTLIGRTCVSRGRALR